MSENIEMPSKTTSDTRRMLQCVNSHGDAIPYLYERNGRYYVYCQIKRKRFSRLISEMSFISQSEAAKRAAKFVRAAKDERWMALDGTKARRDVVYSQLGVLFAAYRAVAARRGNPSANTVERNILALKLIISKAQGRETTDTQECDILTDTLLAQYAENVMADKTGEKRLPAQRSIVSFIRQARSLFAKKMLFDPGYQALTLPDLQRFMNFMPVEAEKYRYEMPAEPFYRKTLEAARKLRETKPNLYLVHLLVYDLGLRASEAAAMRWNWLEHEDSPNGITWRANIKNRPEEGFSVKGREGTVPVSPLVREQLLALKREDDVYILPGGHPTARRDLIQREYSAWLRTMGWKTQKAAHEMRKLRGCFWRHKYGLDRAHEWLRHESYQTTLDYYAALPRREEPASLDQPEGKTHGNEIIDNKN